MGMKALQVTSSKIVVSANSLSETGYNIFHKVRGILPGCRKESDLTFTPMAGYIWVKNLWSYNGSASIDPIDWAKLVAESPVVSDKLSPYAVTPELEAIAHEDARYITVCPAITDRTHVSPKFTPTFTPLAVVRDIQPR